MIDIPDAYEHIMPLERRLARRDAFDLAHNADAAAVLRHLMEHFGAPNVCPRGRCRRAGRCLMPKVDCAWLALPALQEHVFPAFARRMRD